MNRLKLFFILISCLITLGLYTNCGEAFEAAGTHSDGDLLLASESSCDSIKKVDFLSQGHYSFLKTNCNACHISGGIAQGSFADNNSQLAFATFNSFGWARIKENSLDSNHPGPNNGPGLKAQVDQLDVLWQSTLTDYNNCSKRKSNKSLGNYDILTEQIQLNITDEWQTMSWKLLKNQFANNNSYGLDLVFSVDIQNYYGEGERTSAPVGYLFKSPRMSFLGRQDRVYIESIELRSGGVSIENFEVWTNLQVLLEKQNEVAGKTKDSIIINDEQRQFALISDNITSINNLSVAFTNIIDNTGGVNSTLIPDEPNKVEPGEGKPIIERRVTYSDLIGDGEYGVFKSYCLRCHNSDSASGELALDNLTKAQQSVTQIALRINSVSKPMPQSGLMSLKNIAIIEKWIELGAPK